jgi:hypothetical protein
MAMGTRKKESQEQLWIAANAVAQTHGHAFCKEGLLRSTAAVDATPLEAKGV